MNNKKIKITILTDGIHNIKIYNNYNKLIYNNTTYNEVVYFDVPDYGVYKIVISSVYGNIISSFIVSKKSSNNLIYSVKK